MSGKVAEMFIGTPIPRENGIARSFDERASDERSRQERTIYLKSCPTWSAPQSQRVLATAAAISQ